jgi:hypothetical protein
MASLQESQQLLQREYDHIWSDWYAKHGGIKPATLKIHFADGTSGYIHPSNLLAIFISEENIPEIDRQLRGEKHWSGKLKWFVHQAELVHEMLHEYQFKILVEPNPEGRALFAKYRNKFSGPNHNELFFTAIAEKAAYFRVLADELVSEL